MALAGVSVLLLWKIQTQSGWLITGLQCATGFFVYGPQCLLAIACVNLATKRAAATAVGLTSIIGYASTVLSGWGLGFLVQNYGWNAGFAGLMAARLSEPFCSSSRGRPRRTATKNDLSLPARADRCRAALPAGYQESASVSTRVV